MTIPINKLAEPTNINDKGIIEAIKRPKYRSPISLLAILGIKLAMSGYFIAIRKKQIPNVKQNICYV